MRFLVDENLPGGVTALLRDLGHDVFDVAASPCRGDTDQQLWQRAIDEQRIVLTQDLDFPFPGAPELPAGIVIVRPHAGARLASIVHLVQEAMGHLEPDALLGYVTVIEPARIRQRRYRPQTP